MLCSVVVRIADPAGLLCFSNTKALFTEGLVSGARAMLIQGLRLPFYGVLYQLAVLLSACLQALGSRQCQAALQCCPQWARP
jgi:hypothetical protein